MNGEYLLFIQQSRDTDEVGLSIFVDNCGNSMGTPYDTRTLLEVGALANRKK